jgi:hypothetical protein
MPISAGDLIKIVDGRLVQAIDDFVRRDIGKT